MFYDFLACDQSPPNLLRHGLLTVRDHSQAWVVRKVGIGEVVGRRQKVNKTPTKDKDLHIGISPVA